MTKNFYSKQMQQAIQKCKTLIEKHRHLTQMKALTPMLNVQIKIHWKMN